VVTGIAGILLGVIVGYILGAQQAGGGLSQAPTAAAAAPAPGQAAPAAGLVTDAELSAYRDILKNDPRNVRAAVELGNKLYDAGRYAEAIPYYQQALTVEPGNANVSTDLGTALYYAGRPDEALAQLEKTLAVDPAHAQTLFNIGIIKRDAKKDSKGAVEAWQKLLQANPNYSEAAKVRALIAGTGV
jgi:tetratricopeptide (TPR) repeat protein